MKRDLGIKDMSQVIPGHGGLMDRLDSLLATVAPIWLLLHYLVFTDDALPRPARPAAVVRDRPAHEWELDPAGYDDVWALRDRLPQRGAAWFTSPEPKALATAQLLTDTEVGVVDGLREHGPRRTDWIEPSTGGASRLRGADPVGPPRLGATGRLPRTRDRRGRADPGRARGRGRRPGRPRHGLDRPRRELPATDPTSSGGRRRGCPTCSCSTDLRRHRGSRRSRDDTEVIVPARREEPTPQEVAARRGPRRAHGRRGHHPEVPVVGHEEAPDALDDDHDTVPPRPTRFWHRNHPVFTPLSGFFTGVPLVVVLGLLGAILDLVVGYDVSSTRGCSWSPSVCSWRSTSSLSCPPHATVRPLHALRRPHHPPSCPRSPS